MARDVWLVGWELCYLVLMARLIDVRIGLLLWVDTLLLFMWLWVFVFGY